MEPPKDWAAFSLDHLRGMSRTEIIVLVICATAMLSLHFI